ncbi:MAG: CehA/McbA family metallohydrolase [bacterium]
MLGSVAGVRAGEVLKYTSSRSPVVVHDRARGWAESPSMVVGERHTYVAYEASEGGGASRDAGSRVWLARVAPEGGGGINDEAGEAGALRVERIAVSRKGEIAAWPSIAEDSRGAIWVVWTACRGGKWAAMASLAEGMRVSSPVRLSSPTGLVGRVGVAGGDDVVCFVWAERDRHGHRIVARIHDGKLGRAFTVYEGADPVGRPDVHVGDAGRLVFVWDQWLEGRFAIRCRKLEGAQLGPVVTLAGGADDAEVADRADAWEPHIAGPGESFVVSWQQVSAGHTTAEPAVWMSSGAAPALDLAEGDTRDTWRVRSVCDAGGAAWLAWTTRVYGFNTRFFIKPVADGATAPTYTIDLAMERNFMNIFDCAVGENLAIAWDYSGSIYLAEIGLAELRAGARSARGGPSAETSSPSGLGPRGGAAPDEDWESPVGGLPAAGQTTGGRRTGPERRAVCYKGDQLKVYFGDCHNHTSFSDGRAYPDMSLEVARVRRGLDFAAINDHDVTLTPGEFAWTEALASLASERGDFAVLSGFEASKGWAQNGYGHWNVLFAGAGGVLHFEDGMTPDDLYRFARRRHAITIPHHVAKRFAPHDWSYSDPVAEPVVEMCSQHGIFESQVGNQGKADMVRGKFVEDGLGLGRIVGLVGGSDSHNCFEAAQIDQGLTGVYAEDLSPESIFEALARRRTFALTGGCLILDFRCDGHLMGEEVARRAGSTAPLGFEAYAASADSIVSLEIVSGGKVVYAWPCTDGGSVGEGAGEVAGQGARDGGRVEVKVSAEVAAPDSQAYYYLRAATAKGDRAWSSPVWIKPRR